MLKWHMTFATLLVTGLMACGETKSPPTGGGSSSISGSLVFSRQTGENPTPPNDPNPPPAGNSFSGTVSAPAGNDIRGTVIAACVVTQDDKLDCNDPNTKGGQVTTGGSSATFTIPDLAAKRYAVYAWNDINQNGGGVPDGGDLFTFYSDDGTGTVAIIQPPKTNIDLPMYVVQGVNSLLTKGKGLTQATTFTVTNNEVPLIDANTSTLERVNSSAPFIPGDVIVKFRSGMRTQGLTTLQARVNARVLEASPVRSLGALLPNTSLYRSPIDAAGTLELIQQLEQRPDVEYAEPNYISYALKTPNDKLFKAQWHYKTMNLENAWAIADGTAGTPVTVAVVDSGSIDHPDLNGVYLKGYDFVSDPDRSGDGDDGRDDDPTAITEYHGAHVAGTIAASSNNTEGGSGVSWGAKVVPVRALGADGSGSGADISAGIQWAAGISVPDAPDNSNPAKVINLSLGGKRSCSQTEKALYSNLKARGVIVVVAAGNEDDDTNNYAPSSCQDVINVGAVGPQGRRAPYSNYGSRIDVMAPGGDHSQKITIDGKSYSAGVLSTVLDDQGNPVYSFQQGTSMAAPHIAGLVALMVSRKPDLNLETVRAQLKAASTPLSATACQRPNTTDCGAGLVDAARALNSTANPGNPGNPPPAPPAPPATGSLETYVAALACAQANNCELFDENNSAIVNVKATRNQIPFQLTGLKAGTFVAAGWQDLNGNQSVDQGEPFGFFAKPIAITANQKLLGLVIRMQPFVDSTASRFSRADRLESLMQRLASRIK